MEQNRPIRPALTSQEAVDLAARQFGVRAKGAESLPSDRDQNFLLEDEAIGRRFVLKLAHSEEKQEELDLQNRVLEHLGRAGFPLQKVIHSSEGKEIVEVEGPDGVRFLSRLLTWLPGDLLHQVNPQTPSLWQSLGAFLGGVDLALADFSHPAQDRPLKWDLRRAGKVIRTHLLYVEDPRRLAMLEDLTERLVERLRPLEPHLRLGVIHGDANDHNVLVSPPRQDRPEARRVTGILDFGDTVRSYLCAEPAIAGAYAILGGGDRISRATEIVRGYHRVLPLNEWELAALFPLMALRLCVSVVIAALQKRREPDNEYLVVSEGPAWETLEWLSAQGPELPHVHFREACGLEAVPGGRAIETWLEEHGHLAAGVVGRPGEDSPLDLRATSVHVFDLSVGTGEFGLTPAAEDAAGWTRVLFDRMKAVDAEVGVGRYLEPRRWYASEVFAPQGGRGEEWRSVHMGIDLFLDPGAPVFSPFDAVVHSVANNAGDLDYGPTVILEHNAIVPGDHGNALGTGTSLPGGDPDGPLRFFTLYGHLAEDVLTSLSPGQSLARGEAFAQVGDFPVNGNWPPHLHFQIMTHLLGMSGDFPGVCRPSQLPVWQALLPDPNTILGIGRDPEDPEASSGKRLSGVPLDPRPGRTRDELVEARRAHLGPNLSVSYARPLKIVRGLGQLLYDEDGQPYLDCVNNVPHVGHNHPRVVEAGQRQMAVLNTNTRYLHDLIVDYAQRLLSLFPDPLSLVYFVSSGSEANELALRMARAHTGRDDVVVVEGAYHGNTSAMVDLSPYKFDGPGGEGAKPWVHKTIMPDPYRGRFRAQSEATEGEAPGVDVDYLPAEELGRRYADHVHEVLAKMESGGRTPAAFFCESLLGCGGQIVLPDGYLRAAFQHVRTAGGICVADEVQVGFGRVGSRFWGFEIQGVTPDIVTLGKPMGNGHPLAALVTTREIATSFDTGMEYFNTYGGNPVSCAIGMAVLDVLEEERLQENARRVGGHLLAGLRHLMDRHALIGDVRGLGLFIGVEIVEDTQSRGPATRKAGRVKERLRDRRILLSTDGPDDNVLKIKPPMVFTKSDADRLLETLDEVLGEDEFKP